MKFTKDDPRINKNGRGKGKLTDLKNSIIAVYDKLGGTDGLFDWVNSSKRNQDKFYTLIMTKVIPKDLNVNADLSIKSIEFNIVDPKNDSKRKK
jgi:hypothetical protein